MQKLSLQQWRSLETPACQSFWINLGHDIDTAGLFSGGGTLITVLSFESLSSSTTPESLEVKDSSDPLDEKYPIRWTIFDLLLNL